MLYINKLPDSINAGCPVSIIIIIMYNVYNILYRALETLPAYNMSFKYMSLS